MLIWDSKPQLLQLFWQDSNIRDIEFQCLICVPKVTCYTESNTVYAGDPDTACPVIEPFPCSVNPSLANCSAEVSLSGAIEKYRRSCLHHHRQNKGVTSALHMAQPIIAGGRTPVLIVRSFLHDMVRCFPNHICVILPISENVPAVQNCTNNVLCISEQDISSQIALIDTVPYLLNN